MITSPDITAVREMLARVQARMTVRYAMQGAAAGFAFAAMLEATVMRAGELTFAERVGIVLVCAVTGAVARLTFVMRTRKVAARLIERVAPQCQNVVITAEELLDTPDRVKPNVGALVQQQAARIVGSLTMSLLVPIRRSLVILGVAIILWLAAALRPIAAHVFPATHRTGAIVTPSVRAVHVVINAPAYSARPPITMRDPLRIDALAGSTITLTVSAEAERVNVETVRGVQTLARGVSREYTGTIPVDVDGFIAIEPALTRSVRTEDFGSAGIATTHQRGP